LEVFDKTNVDTRKKLDHFEKYVRRQSLARFVARYELFKMQMNVKGSIIECGVHYGGGLFAWAKLSSALEPYALDRRVFGFDTFEGFPDTATQDKSHDSERNAEMRKGGFHTGYNVYEELEELVQEYDNNRFLNQFQKIFLVKGDATQTIPRFVNENPYLMISLLFMDFDLFEPTKVALEHFLPLMPKGAILAFDEINNPWWPGETIALRECLDLNQYKINRFPFDPNIAYIVL